MDRRQVALQSVIEALHAVLEQRDDVELAILFGSRARGVAREGSDLDLALLAPGADLLTLGAELSRAVSLEVDLVSLEDPGVPLLEEIVRDGVVVYQAMPGAAARWRSFTLSMLELDRPWFARMRDAWLRHVAERGLNG
jgi:predicted nucleotidyltransferase